ncbi:MAG: rhamnulokinase [Planctomycetes bacterium]|nr:rhamnulokinase [Planctomycetota bacterium]
MLGIVSAGPPHGGEASPKAGKIRLEEVHRFINGPVEQNGSLRWDFSRLMSEVKTGIGKAAKESGDIAGIGVDSWGVDFGLLDDNGNLIENPYHYRDSRTNGMIEKACELLPKREIYEHTGIQFMQFNTVYQLLSMRLSGSPVLAKAKRLIFIADLVSYLLSGKPYAEYTMASTSQLMDMRTGKWSRAIFEKMNLPIEIMPEVVNPGTIIGTLTKNVAKEIGCGEIPVLAVGSHDTASAVAAVPADRKTKWAYLSSGTWSLIGVETPNAIVNDKTFAYPFTNEGGVEGTIRLLKNIMGLWLLQECKKHWQKQGIDLSYDQLTELAAKAKSGSATIDVDNSCFLAPGDMPRRLNDYLTKTGQKPIDDKGQMVRMILENLARKYTETINRLENVIGNAIDHLHVVGGGSQNDLLNQFTADATGKIVTAGPAEATAIGNVLMQARATGQLGGISQARHLVRNSFTPKQYQPKDTTPKKNNTKK